MDEPTEETRRSLLVAINTHAADREALQVRYGQVWDTSELASEFEVLEFAAPFQVIEEFFAIFDTVHGIEELALLERFFG